MELTSPRGELEPDCAACFGLCCVALPLTRSADFPVSKPAGEPCRNLLSDHRCGIHDQLRAQGWKGCTVYDCFGAGQHVSQVVFGGVSWRDAPETAAAMFAALPVVHQLHEMLSLLAEAADLARAHAGGGRGERDVARVEELAAEVRTARGQVGRGSATLDVAALRSRVGPVLVEVSHAARESVRRGQAIPALPGRLRSRLRAGADLAGADLRAVDLRAVDLRGALLIGADLRDADLRHADLLGADLRDADLRGARLEGAIYLSRPQLAAARR